MENATEKRIRCRLGLAAEAESASACQHRPQPAGAGREFRRSIGRAAEPAAQQRLTDLLPALVGKRNKIELRAHSTRRPLPKAAPFRDHWQLCYERSLADDAISRDERRRAGTHPAQPIGRLRTAHHAARIRLAEREQLRRSLSADRSGGYRTRHSADNGRTGASQNIEPCGRKPLTLPASPSGEAASYRAVRDRVAATPRPSPAHNGHRCAALSAACPYQRPCRDFRPDSLSRGCRISHFWQTNCTGGKHLQCMGLSASSKRKVLCRPIRTGSLDVSVVCQQDRPGDGE